MWRRINHSRQEPPTSSRNDRFGGLLRYGIPDFKMEKGCIDRRLDQISAEGIVFKAGIHVGEGRTTTTSLAENYDAIALCAGAEHPRDLVIPGRELDGIHFAMDFLPLQNRRNAGDQGMPALNASNRRVVVIGGGDTGSDCIGTARRQGARSIAQLEILPEPPELEDKLLTWPAWPVKKRTSSSHKEGCARSWSVAATRASGRNGRIDQLHYRRASWRKANGSMHMALTGAEEIVAADLVLLAMGYLHTRCDGLIKDLVERDERGNVRANDVDFKTSLPKVFGAGDMRRGQSLVVTAIRDGRQCARAIDLFLNGSTFLPR